MKSSLWMRCLSLLPLLSPALCAQSLLVVNQGDATVSIINPAQGKQVAVIEEGVQGVHAHEIAVTPDGHTAFLPIYGSTGVGKPGIDGTEVRVVDLTTRRITSRIDFGKGVRPHLPVIDARRNLIYVTTELNQSVTAINLSSGMIVGAIPTGQEQSHMLALSHDGKRGYTANVGPGTVSVLDMVARKTLAVVPVAGNVQRIAISADDKLVFTADQTAPRLAVIDTHSNKVDGWIDLPGTGYGSAATADGRWLLIAIPATDEVAVVDIAARKVMKKIGVGKKPQEVLITPDGKMAYVSCTAGGTVDGIDLKSWSVKQSIAVGKLPDGLAWAK